MADALDNFVPDNFLPFAPSHQLCDVGAQITLLSSGTLMGEGGPTQMEESSLGQRLCSRVCFDDVWNPGEEELAANMEREIKELISTLGSDIAETRWQACRQAILELPSELPQVQPTIVMLISSSRAVLITILWLYVLVCRVLGTGLTLVYCGDRRMTLQRYGKPSWNLYAISINCHGVLWLPSGLCCDSVGSSSIFARSNGYSHSSPNQAGHGTTGAISAACRPAHNSSRC